MSALPNSIALGITFLSNTYKKTLKATTMVNIIDMAKYLEFMLPLIFFKISLLRNISLINLIICYNRL